MIWSQGYMMDVTTNANLVLIVFGKWSKMCGVLHCYADKEHHCDLPMLAAFTGCIGKLGDLLHAHVWIDRLDNIEKTKRMRHLLSKSVITSLLTQY